MPGLELVGGRTQTVEAAVHQHGLLWHHLDLGNPLEQRESQSS